MMRLLSLALMGSACALRIPTVQHAAQAGKTVLCASLCSASLLAGSPAFAVPPTIEEVIVESTAASYPILEALDEGFPGFTDLLGKIILDVGPKKLGPAISLGTDVFNSVPDEKVAAFNKEVKEVYSGLKTDSCTLVPLPSSSAFSRFTAMAKDTVEAGKLKAFNDKWASSYSALVKTDSKICLPSQDGLTKLALAQAEIGRSFDYDTSKKFFDYSAKAFKGEIGLTDETLGLLQSAKAQAPDASFKDRVTFEKAMKKLESASKKEKEKNAAIRYKAKMAEEAAAKKAMAGK